MALEFYTTNELTPLLLTEVTHFLDGQETSHLFQFPQWSISSARFALLREEEHIRWFSAFGTHSPAGRVFPWMCAIVANRGPVCDDGKLWQAVTEEFAQLMRQEGFVYFDASPDWLESPGVDSENHFRGSGWERLNRQRSSLRLDLTRSEDEIFANFRKNTRYEVRRAEGLGVLVESASCDASIEEFLSLHARLAMRKRFLADSQEDVRGAIRWLISGNGRGALLLARSEQRVYGGVVLGRSGSRCWYVWGASESHERFSVGHLLQWKALLWAKSQGCRDYDFGGYTPGATSGPAWFKEGFGGTVVHFVPPHRKVIRRGRYRMLNVLLQMRKVKHG